MSLPDPERLLRSFGVETPEEIDLEAIAWNLGVVEVKVRELDGCEARIVGKGDIAIISVDPRAISRRRRFSIAHELGHWMCHHGQNSFCRTEDIQERNAKNPVERQANAFAAHLLLPDYLLQPIARRLPKLTVKSVREVADRFQTSLTATTVRLIETNICPTMMIAYGRSGRLWFNRSRLVPERWFPAAELHHDTYAFNLLHNAGPEQASTRRIGADAFFDRWDADRVEVEEQSFRVSNDQIMTLIHFSDRDMLKES